MAEPVTPRLVVLSPGSDQGRRIPLIRERVTLGRQDSCDVRLDEPTVSRTHAELRCHAGRVAVRDLGSSGGTYVNGEAVTSPRELRSGDVLALAGVRLRYDAGAGGSSSEQPTSVQAAAVRYDIGHQRAEEINNVARDQYNSYVQHVTQQRDTFLREIAATRTKARYLLWIGVVLFIGGGGLFAAGVLGLMSQVTNGLNSQSPTMPIDPMGRKIDGVPSGLVGWALAALGGVLIVLGLILHVVATSRRRRVDRELTVQPPSPSPRYRGGGDDLQYR